MKLLEDVLTTITFAWLFSLIFGTPFTIVTIQSIVYGIPTYHFCKPLVTVMYRNYRKEIYHGPREDR